MNMNCYQELHPLISCFLKGQAASAQEVTGWTPKVDIKETEDAFVVCADVPGVDPKEIMIDMEDNLLTLRGEKQSIKAEKEEDHYRRERVSGKFYRQFTLPESIASDKISATSKHGVLTIHLPKEKESKLQRTIKVAEQ